MITTLPELDAATMEKMRPVWRAADAALRGADLELVFVLAQMAGEASELPPFDPVAEVRRERKADVKRGFVSKKVSGCARLARRRPRDESAT